jgi:beta-lactamase class A
MKRLFPVMKKTWPFILFAYVLAGCATQKGYHALRQQITKEFEMPGAVLGLAFKDLQKGKTILINSKQVFHAASTYKAPVLMEIFRQQQDGKLSLEDSIFVKNSFRSIVDGSSYTLDAASDGQQELYKEVGKFETVHNLAVAMITRSSNLATNLLLEKIGAENVMNSLQDAGIRDIRVLRGVEDIKAYDKGLNNTVTAGGLMLFYNKMASGKLVSKRASEQMISILEGQQFNEIIPALLPRTVGVAHKTGSISGHEHDSGIVSLPDGRKYVLVLLSRFENEKPEEITRKLARISRIIYDHMMKE